jgi:hypothetical protein
MFPNEIPENQTHLPPTFPELHHVIVDKEACQFHLRQRTIFFPCTGSQIATWQGDAVSANPWTGLAATLKDAVNANAFDSAIGYIFILSCLGYC